MKYKREIKVAVLAIVCGFLLIYGLHFLKGVNLFSPTKHYWGEFADISGLTEQAPVRVRGYKVGQVDKITYDFTKESAFRVLVSVDKHILVPQGSEMVLVADGLLGGKAIEVRVPVGMAEAVYGEGDTLPTSVELSLVETLEQGVLAKLDSVMGEIDLLVKNVNGQLEGDHLKTALANVDRISRDLTVSANDIRRLTHNDMPGIVRNADTVVATLKNVSANIREVDLQATVHRADSVIERVQTIVSSKDGTVGLLLNDKGLYTHIDSTVVSVDSLVSDLKANPKRYVHFSLFGPKEKKKK